MTQRPTPLNKEAALKQLRDEYESVMGKPVDSLADMICEISAERAMRQNWKWVKEKSLNWSASLHWL
jgi:hypothetical protein